MSLPKVVILIALLAGIVVGGLAFARHRTTNLASKPPASIPGAIRYLPLGDSYTIGESVPEQSRWPNQLTAQLASQGTVLQIVANPSVTGYTSQDLIDHELPLVTKLKPDFVTILIGVNDYVQGVSKDTFQKNLAYIVEKLQQEMAEPKNIVLVTIPDYGKTPAGAQFGSPETSQAGVEAFNAIIQQVASSQKLPVADIFPVSQQVTKDPALIAKDGLHPSAKQYAAWTNIIEAIIRNNGLLK